MRERKVCWASKRVGGGRLNKSSCQKAVHRIMENGRMIVGVSWRRQATGRRDEERALPRASKRSMWGTLFRLELSFLAHSKNRNAPFYCLTGNSPRHSW